MLKLTILFFTSILSLSFLISCDTGKSTPFPLTTDSKEAAQIKSYKHVLELIKADSLNTNDTLIYSLRVGDTPEEVKNKIATLKKEGRIELINNSVIQHSVINSKNGQFNLTGDLKFIYDDNDKYLESINIIYSSYNEDIGHYDFEEPYFNKYLNKNAYFGLDEIYKVVWIRGKTFFGLIDLNNGKFVAEYGACSKLREYLIKSISTLITKED